MVRRRVGRGRRFVRGDMIVVLLLVLVGVVVGALLGESDELWMVGEGKVGRMFVLVCGMWIFAVSLVIEEWKRRRSCGWRIFAARMVMGWRTRRYERSS